MVEGFANMLLLSIGKLWNIDTFYIVVYLQIMKPSCPVFKCSRSTIAIIRIKGIENILRQPFFWVLNAKQSGEIVKEVFVFFTLEENHTTDRLLITSTWFLNDNITMSQVLFRNVFLWNRTSYDIFIVYKAFIGEIRSSEHRNTCTSIVILTPLAWNSLTCYL